MRSKSRWVNRMRASWSSLRIAMIHTRSEQPMRSAMVSGRGHGAWMNLPTRASLAVGASPGAKGSRPAASRIIGWLGPSLREDHVDATIARPCRFVGANCVHGPARRRLCFLLLHAVVHEVGCHRVGPRLSQSHIVVASAARIRVAYQLDGTPLERTVLEASDDLAENARVLGR